MFFIPPVSVAESDHRSYFIVILKHPRTAKGNKLVLSRSSVASGLDFEVRNDSEGPISHKEPQ